MKKVLGVVLKIAIIIGIIGAVSLCALFIRAGNPELDTDKIENYVAKVSVYDSDGSIIAVSGANSYVTYENIPDNLINAFVSIEDKKFFEHNGVDYQRILGATWQNIKSFSFAEGASTITQQLIKNTHLSTEKTITRKIQEIKLALALEKEWDKEKILESYLNIVYFGSNLYGVESASNAFFSKNVSELSLAECATLAAVVKSPAEYSPLKNLENSKNRRNLVLAEMKEDGKISVEDYETCINQELIVTRGVSDVNQSYMNEVLNEATNILNIDESDIITQGLKIYTFLDSETQKTLTSSITNTEYAPLTQNNGNADAIGIVTDNHNGAVIAYYNNTFYLSSALRRQPASTVKPFVAYMPALEKGLLSPLTQLNDSEINLNGYTPNNFNENYYGWVNVRTAVAKSLNIPAVLAMNYVGVDDAISYAQAFGLSFDENDYSLATALGGMTYGLTSKELTEAYMSLANEGNFISTAFISKICTADGEVLYEHSVNSQKVAEKDTVYLMTDMLKTVATEGSGQILNTLNYNVACKTGTNAYKNTSYSNDMYNISYTTANTCFVWYGNIDNTEEDAIKSIYSAAKSPTAVVKSVFESLYLASSPADFAVPEQIVKLQIDGERLTRDHIVSVANEYSAEKLAVESIFSTRNLPADYATQFDIVVNDFNAEIYQGLPQITFTTYENYEYRLYRKDIFGNIVLLKECIDCTNDTVIFVDNTVVDGNSYEYYVTPQFCSCKGKREGTTTNSIEITVPFALL